MTFRKVLLVAMMLAVIGLAVPAGADPTVKPGARIELRNLTVLDADAAPFTVGTAGVLACPLAGGDCSFGSADATGHVNLTTVQATVEYRVTGFATNTGWCTPGFVAPDGTTFHFSEAIETFGRDLARPTTFVVAEPNCTTVTILDGAGNPFPAGTAGIFASPVEGGEMVFGAADANGTVQMTNLDPNVEYQFTAYATNTGWCNPYVDPDTGTTFHFSGSVQGTPGEVEGTTFAVAEPNCGTTVTILDGAGNPFPAGTAGIFASPVEGGEMVFGGADANGTVQMTNLDPNVEYQFTAYATNTGWCDPYVDPDTGTAFHFSGSVQGTPGEVEGTTFVVAEPNCGGD